ncbi:unnamed protein product [Parascedosporium putredinis]|uniref:Uncharacterized protein n=1 Tax=Parascedosporium putredinis TaxID=1442378 RepID=A0A9P1HBD0_9PEZI|nr:unnamed protein product [Parascedosporium putredinis]CAI8004826.1 unnamed protein product [Parascedosporium putredinis]
MQGLCVPQPGPGWSFSSNFPGPKNTPGHTEAREGHSFGMAELGQSGILALASLNRPKEPCCNWPTTADDEATDSDRIQQHDRGGSPPQRVVDMNGGHVKLVGQDGRKGLSHVRTRLKTTQYVTDPLAAQRLHNYLNDDAFNNVTLQASSWQEEKPQDRIKAHAARVQAFLEKMEPRLPLAHSQP